MNDLFIKDRDFVIREYHFPVSREDNFIVSLPELKRVPYAEDDFGEDEYNNE